MASRYGWQVDPGTVAELSDVLTGLGVVISNYTPADAPIVVLTPCYMPFIPLLQPAQNVVTAKSISSVSTNPVWTVDLASIK